MPALRIGLLIVDGVTLDEVAPVRERLENLGANVTAVVPTGGPVLPVSGRYYPAAGGHAARRPLSQVSVLDFDLLWLPDSLNSTLLQHYPQLLTLLRGQTVDGHLAIIPVMTTSYLTRMLQHSAALHGLMRPAEAACTISAGGRA